MAVSELAPHPVSFYAAVFFLVNVTYIGLIWELIEEKDLPPTLFKRMRVRAIVTLCCFGMAAIVALKFPLVALGACICCLIFYLRPAPGPIAS